MPIDNRTIFKLLSYPKEEGTPPAPTERLKLKTLARFELREFFQANYYFQHVTKPDTKTVSRKVYLDSEGRLFHVEFKKEKPDG